MNTPLLASLVCLAPALHATDVGGPIDIDTTWSLADSPFVVTSDVFVGSGATLTIEAGVEVRFNSGIGLFVGSVQPGVLVAQGTPSSPIELTFNDPLPNPGGWEGIDFDNTTPASILEHCIVEDGGFGTNNANVRVSSSSPTIRDCTLRGSDGYGLYVFGTGVDPVVVDNAFEDNGTFPVRVEIASFPTTLTGNSFTGNGEQAIEISGGTLSQDLTLADPGVAYRVSSDITVQGAFVPQLTIADGVEMRFATSAGLHIGTSLLARLDVQGTPGNGVLFTSDADTPAPGDWDGLRINNYAIAPASLSSCTIEYAGQSNTGSLVVASSEPTITDLTIRHGMRDGLEISAASPDVQGATIEGSGRYGVYILSSSPMPALDALDVSGQPDYGVYVAASNSGGSLTGSTVENGIYFTSLTTMSISGNTFSNYDAFPTRIEAESVGAFVNGNTLTGIVDGSSVLEVLADTVRQSATWPDLGVAYVLVGDVRVHGPSSPVLTLAPAVELRFETGIDLGIGATSGQETGALVAVGTQDDPILFTSNQSAPAPGDWQYVQFRANALGTSILERCILEYAGSSSSAIHVSSSPTFRDVTIRDSALDGIYCLGSSTPTIEDVTIENSGRYGLRCIGTTAPTISNLTVTTPADFGVYGDSATVGGSLTGSSIDNSVFFTGVTSMQITGNAFANYDPFPARIGASSVGQLVTQNTFDGVVPGSSTLEVSAQTVREDATWPDLGFRYVIRGNVTVADPSGPTLTLDPGVQLAFDASIQLQIGSSSSASGSGTLVAQGTAGDPILFTANHEAPTPGFWSRLLFEDTASAASILEHCTVEYGGHASFGTALVYVDSSSPTLRDLTLRESGLDGLRIHASDPLVQDVSIDAVGRRGVHVSSPSAPTLDGVTVTNAVDYGIWCSTSAVGGSITGCDIENSIRFGVASTASVTGNVFRVYNAFPAQMGANQVGEFLSQNATIGVNPGISTLEVLAGTVAESTTWANKGIVVVALGDVSVTGPAAPVLTLEPGLEIRFGPGVEMGIGSSSGPSFGGLQAIGTAVDPIVFTSNSDTPAAGDWQYLLFRNTALASSAMEHCLLEYGGSTSGTIYCDGSPTLRNLTIRESQLDGIFFDDASEPTVEDTAIEGAGRYGLQVTDTSSPILDGLTITGSADYGVYVVSSAPNGSLTNSAVENSIYFVGDSQLAVTGNTFSNYDPFPTRLVANRVGEFLANNTLQDTVPGSSALEVLGDTIDKGALWPAAGVAYEIHGNLLVQGSVRPILTLAPGVEMRFNLGADLTVGSSQPGTLVAQGAPGQPILFTANSESPTSGFWSSIRFNNFALPGSVLEECVVEYAGRSDAMVYASASAPTLRNLTLRHGNFDGLRFRGGSIPTVDDVSIENCGRYGVYVDGNSAPMLDDITVVTPGNYGVYVSSSSVGGSLTGSAIDNGIYFTGATTMSVSGNSFHDYDAYPTRVGANSVGPLLSGNTFQDFTPDVSEVEVLGQTVSDTQTWPDIGLRYRMLSSFGISGSSAPVLTIGAGSVLRFNTSVALTVGAASSTTPGGLLVQGTESEPVLLTSSSDTPAAGNWSQVYIDNSALPLTTLEHCTIEYSGSSTNSAVVYCDTGTAPTLRDVTIREGKGDGVRLTTASATLENLTIENVGRYGLYVTGTSSLTATGVASTGTGDYGVYVSTASASGSLTSSSFDSGLWFSSATTMDVTGCSFDDYTSFPTRIGANSVGQLLTQNTFGGIAPGDLLEVMPQTLVDSTLWPNMGLDYQVRGTFAVRSPGGTTWALDPGISLRFLSGAEIEIGSSTESAVLVAQGTAGQPIVFTTDSPSPAPGQWGGIEFVNTTPASIFEHCVVEYGGSGFNDANIRCTDSSPTIRFCTLSNSVQAGIEITGGAPIIEHNTFSGNLYGINAFSSASPKTVVRSNDFGGNTNGMLSGSGGLNARLNYWGDPSGPSGSGPGVGDSVDAETVFEPWLEGPFDASFELLHAVHSPSPFSQAGNTSEFHAVFAADANWAISILDDTQTLVRSFIGTGGSLAQEWVGDDDLLAALPNGDYTYRIDAASTGSGTPASAALGRVTLDDTLPIARITAPDPDEMTATSVPILGSASSPTFTSYTLEYGGGHAPTSWTTITSSSTPVTAGTLGTWDTSNLTLPVYAVRLEVSQSGGPDGEDRVTLRNLAITGLAASNPVFSPNGDLVKDTSILGASLTWPVDWTIDVEDAGAAAVTSFAGKSDEASAEWDGTDSLAAAVPDGPYDFDVQATDAASGVSVGSSTAQVIVDTAPPTIAIFEPTELGTVFSSQAFDVEGRAEDANFDFYSVSLGEGIPTAAFTQILSTTTPVTGVDPDDVLAMITPKDHDAGAHTIRLRAEDLGGNVSELDRGVFFDFIEITDVYTLPSVVEPVQGEKAGIHFTLSHDADVTVDVYDFPDKTFVTSLSFPGLLAGDNSVEWDGRDQLGMFSSLNEGHYLVLTAADPSGRDGCHGDAVNPPLGPTPSWGATTNDGSSFDPYRNDVVTISYNVNGWMRSTLNATGSGLLVPLNPTGVFPPGPGTLIWDGRNQNGEIHTGGFSFYFGVPLAFVQDPIYLVDEGVRFDGFRAEAYLIHPLFGEVSRFDYDLSSDATVSISISDPNGSHVRSLVTSEAQSAGPQSAEWDGRTDGGSFVQVEGNYDILLSAIDPATGLTHERRGVIVVYR